MRRTKDDNSAFTMVELLVVIAILGTLMSVLLPSLERAREAARRTQCLNNLKQYGHALHAYHNANRAFPIGNVPDRWWGFQSRLLPYFELQYIYQNINYDFAGDCFQACNALPPALDPGNQVQNFDMCPDDPLAGQIWYAFPDYGHHGCTDYLGVMGTSPAARDGILLYGGTTLHGPPVSIAKITDGVSRTLIMGERGISNDLFGWPYCGYGDGTGNGDNLCSTGDGLVMGNAYDDIHKYHFWSYHRETANFLMADGSDRTLTYEIDYFVFQALGTRAGGETLPVP